MRNTSITPRNKIVAGARTVIAIIFAVTFSVTILTIIRPYFSRWIQPSSTEVNQHQLYQILGFVSFPFSDRLPAEILSPTEALHLHEVRSLFIINYFLLIISISLLLFMRNRKSLSYAPAGAWKYIGIACILIALLVLSWWSEAFNFFHKVLFPYNNYWQLDPQSSQLLRLFPGEMFYEAFIILTVMTIGISIALKRAKFV